MNAISLLKGTVFGASFLPDGRLKGTIHLPEQAKEDAYAMVEDALGVEVDNIQLLGKEFTYSKIYITL